jgi:hypothetical protein
VTGTNRRLTLCADAVRLAILCSAGVFVAIGEGHAALKAVLVLLPAVTARLVQVNPALDLLFALALGAEAVGTAFAAYHQAIGGDTFPHIALPLLSGPVLYVGLVRLGAVPGLAVPPSPRRLLGAAIVTLASVLALGTAWELLEWSADTALGTNYSQGSDDTLGDLFNDAIAAAASGALVALWIRAGARRPSLAMAAAP